MKKNKLTKNLPVKGNHKLTTFFKKAGERSEQISPKLVESSGCCANNSLDRAESSKRRYNWDIDDNNLEKENRDGCVKHPCKKKSVDTSGTGLSGNGRSLAVPNRSPIKIHHNKYEDPVSGECSHSESVRTSPKQTKTPPKIKLYRTPTKNKTPTKLYNKSPKKLHQFNVEVITNFVTLTPSKTNHEKLDGTPTKHYVDDTKQPISNRSIEAQKRNEQTPTKSNLQITYLPISSSVKVKLDFDKPSCNVQQKVEVNKTDDGNTDLQPNNSQESFNFTDDESSLFEKWDDSFFRKEEEAKYTLSLADRHCKVLNVNSILQDVKLTVQSLENREKAICMLKGFWTNLKVNVGNEVYISASYDNSKSYWYIDNTRGLIVYEPSHLISITSVVGALFCKRRAFLAECFRGFEPPNTFMVLGTFVHELLQSTLRNNYFALYDIKNLAQKKINSPEIIHQMYSSSVKPEDFAEQVSDYSSRVFNFVNRYIKKQGGKIQAVTNSFNSRDNWKGQIDNIKDIEENIWCPQLGIKGKIDVTCETNSTIMPLELKTGRASVSLEHRGQIMLYIMMLAKLGYDVSSGLLLYLKEEVLREVPVTANEKRDLIILRNELAYYLSNSSKGGNKSQKDHIHIPEPINHHSACGNCPYNILCCTYLKYENKNLQNYKHLKEVQSSVLAHLKPVHIDYFVKWSYLLDLEAENLKNTKTIKEIYTVPPAEREKKGCCIIDLRIREINYDGDHLYSTTFDKVVTQENTNFYLSGIGEGNYIVVSIDSRPAVAVGFVSYIGKTDITVSLDRDLNKLYPNRTFHLDTYESSFSGTFNKNSLAIILDDSCRAAKLREFIIEKKVPTFQTKLSKKVIIKGTPILRTLNKLQQRAVLKALSSDNFLLIQGMPGSGKTATIAALVQLMVELEKTVLITSHTHSAVDNVCVRLIDKNMKLLRLGSESRIHPKLHPYSENTLTRDCKTVEQLEEIYNNANIVAVTCLGSSHPLISKRVFDVCIIDESTQIVQCSAFRPLYACEKFILVGDPHQLPPVVKNRVALEKGLSESLFDRLQQPESLVKLTCNYRMNKRLTEVANLLTYNGELEVANDDVGNGTLQLPKIEVVLMWPYTRMLQSEWCIRGFRETKHVRFENLAVGVIGNDHFNQNSFICLPLPVIPEIDANIVISNRINSYKRPNFKDCKNYYKDQPWLLQTLNNSITSSFQILDTGPTWNLKQDAVWYRNLSTPVFENNEVMNHVNSCEISIVVLIVRALLKAGLAACDIGIIAPYSLQVATLSEVLKDFEDIEVKTVDQFQGKDKEIIIYSCTKSPDLSKPMKIDKYNILEDKRRLTVAITRAKHKFILLGHMECVRMYSPFKQLLDKLPENNFLKLQNGQLGFSWENVMNI